jgi:hypothetical protein
MPRGKPFACWISSPGKYRDVALHIGDEVELRLPSGNWIQGKFGCSRSGIFPYFVKSRNTKYGATLLFNLRPVQTINDLYLPKFLTPTPKK